MIYLFIGDAGLEKDRQIADLKTKALPAHAVAFDYESLDGNKLDAAVLKQALMAFPAVAKRRFILVRNAHRLSKDNQKIISDFSEASGDNADVVLDWAGSEGRGAFVKTIGRTAKVVRFQTQEKQNVFDLTRLMGRDPVNTLKLLNQLYDNGDHPLQLLGGLVWFWGNRAKPRLSAENFKRGLKALQDADVNIKRSRMRPEHAVEMCVIKLGSYLR